MIHALSLLFLAMSVAAWLSSRKTKKHYRRK